MSPILPIDLHNPADVARETFRRLASQRISPTPEAYREIYQQITGGAEVMTAERMLAQFAASLNSMPADLADLGKLLDHALAQQDWASYGTTLKRMLMLTQTQTKLQRTTQTKPVQVRKLNAQATQGGLKGGIEALAVRQRTSPATIEAIPAEEVRIRILRELLHRTLSYALSALLQEAPELAQESEALADSMQAAYTEAALNEVSVRLKQLCFKVELKSGDLAEQHELMLRLFRLLLNSVNDVVDEESWLGGQIGGVQEIMARPISHAALNEAMRNLKDIIFQHGLLKQSLADALQTRENLQKANKDLLAAQQRIRSLETELEQTRKQLSDRVNTHVNPDAPSP